MPAPTGNKYAQNSKGGGRPNSVDEQIRDSVINMSWERLKTIMEDKKKPSGKLTKDQIAMEIAKRTIPQEVHGGKDKQGNNQPIQINIVRPDGD